MIDLRSDTVTRPCKAMLKHMYAAEVGDDVFGDDPTVNAVQEKVASLVGHEAALLVPSGTQSNLIGLLTHCGRGDEYLVGQDYHAYLYEAGGAASLGGIVPQPINVEPDGTISLDRVSKLIKPDDSHFAKTRLLCLENTHSGKVISNDYLEEAKTLATKHSLRTHLDGARVCNAAVAQGIEVSQITQHFDSVSICFSKGLGAPAGSMLCGTKSFIQSAHRWRKMVGGGMRQSGILAAAIDYAIEHNIARLEDDHSNSKLLESKLLEIEEITVSAANTNMLYFEFKQDNIAAKIGETLQQKGILICADKRVRLVTHLDIDGEKINYFINELKKALVA